MTNFDLKNHNFDQFDLKTKNFEQFWPGKSKNLTLIPKKLTNSDLRNRNVHLINKKKSFWTNFDLKNPIYSQIMLLLTENVDLKKKKCPMISCELKLLWYCSKAALILLWNCSGTALKLLWKCSEIALKMLLNCSVNALKLLWNWKVTWQGFQIIGMSEQSFRIGGLNASQQLRVDFEFLGWLFYVNFCWTLGRAWLRETLAKMNELWTRTNKGPPTSITVNNRRR